MFLKFPGKRPRDLGSSAGRFSAAATWKPNWVSSQVAPADPHYIAPLAQHDGAQALQSVKRALEKMDRVVIVSSKPDYLHAEFSTPGLGFTDDLELSVEGTALHVRSSSRLGIRDLGVNRKRVEMLRRILQS